MKIRAYLFKSKEFISLSKSCSKITFAFNNLEIADITL